jgi:L-ascorbate metabolism protein UlaG (beta-lactamase superfamily)
MRATHQAASAVLSSLFFAVTGAQAQSLAGDRIPTSQGDLIVHPVAHGSFVLGWDGKTIYNDPVGGAEAFAELPAPDIILISDVHGDHMDAATLQAIVESDTTIIAPAAVAEQLPEALQARITRLANGESQTVDGVGVEGVPMYNLTADRLQYHEKGRGNGYVLTLGDTRVYISGDTEDTPEMRALEDIDVAFICFNLPYTMTEEQAASAVREFSPRIVYPYHYRGSDVNEFASLVGSGSGTEVRLAGWY